MIIITFWCKLNQDIYDKDLVKINKIAYQWKVTFSPDPIKQAQEVIFTEKISKEDHTSLELGAFD